MNKKKAAEIMSANSPRSSGKRPVHIGDLVEAHARLIHRGRTNMHILVKILPADPRQGTFVSATECIMVFVAVGPNRHSATVPRSQPRDDKDLQQFFATATQRDPEAKPLGRIVGIPSLWPDFQDDELTVSGPSGFADALRQQRCYPSGARPTRFVPF